MFELTLIDHLRLTFGHVIYRHRVHSQVACSRWRWSRWLRAAEALLMIGVLAAAIATLFGGGKGYMIASAVFAGLALLPLLAHLTFDFDRSARAHTLCATRLWHMRERYRAFLSDLRDGAIDINTARSYRDALLLDLHAIYEHAPPEDAQVYQRAGEAVAVVDEPTLSDEEIDLFLPKSLQKAGKSATA